MNSVLETDSTLTDRYQTTVPEPVRRALRLNKRDRIRYELLVDGTVRLTRVEPTEEDPVIAKFLTFLESDMASHPAHIDSLDAAFVQGIQDLVKGVEIDLDAPLPADDR
ncbi:MAG TPA: type II toxin-antitoxin system PrlF family antitoxin [Bryobacteraceae bacterium]|jgi:hypothetical protein|nr:type II toxin-antitoxin system PrlF family antitoxin [Bryobacteraceae bacterium]